MPLTRIPFCNSHKYKVESLWFDLWISWDQFKPYTPTIQIAAFGCAAFAKFREFHYVFRVLINKEKEKTRKEITGTCFLTSILGWIPIGKIRSSSKRIIPDCISKMSLRNQLDFMEYSESCSYQSHDEVWLWHSVKAQSSFLTGCNFWDALFSRNIHDELICQDLSYSQLLHVDRNSLH